MTERASEYRPNLNVRNITPCPSSNEHIPGGIETADLRQEEKELQVTY
jgi:hypothetical protein